MKQQEDNYTILFEKNPLAMIVIDKDDFTFRKVNARAISMLNYSEEELLGKKFIDIVPEEDHEFLKTEFKKINEEKDLHVYTRNIKKGGEQIDVELVAIQIEYDKKPSILKIATDITAKKESEKVITKLNHYLKERTKELESAYNDINEYNKELEQASRSKDKFISIISHDLRNPIAAILSSSDILKGNLKAMEEDEMVGFINVINESSRKVIAQLDELVEWSKQSTKKINFNPSLLNLHEYVAFSLELIRVNAEQKKIQITNQIDYNLIVKADPLLLRSILQNLVTNAIKFTPDGGKISIDAVQKNKNFIEVSVSDNGIGISQKKLKGLFDYDNMTKDQVDGSTNTSGLGLLLVKDFVEKHKGAVRVESEPGKGTTFYFSLPAS
jgi:two-component system, sensor histidine kinase and response regulator